MMELTRKRTRILSVVFSLITLFLFLVGAAQAATFCVSDAAGLHNALSQAASNGEDDTVQIVQGTYVGNFIYASTEAFGVTIEGGYTAYCASREVDPADTVLDGDAAGNVLVLSCPDQAVEFVVDGVTLQNGNASNNEGGGLFAETYSGEVTLTNNTITENSAGLYGGGVYVDGSTVTLTNNTITENSAGLDGGGVCIHGSTVTLTNNTITENSAGRYSGGVYVYNSTTVTLTNNTITENSADSGGGVYIYLDDNSEVTLTNNTITENSADSGGGVYIYLNDNSDTAHIYNNIIYNNTAVSDGNDLFIYNDGNGDFIPSIVNLYNNDFDQSALGTYIQIPFSIDPSNLDNLDPLFVDATSGDYHLIEGSSCIDAGDNSAPALPETDKDGQPRIIDGIVDMGAYEYPGSAAPVPEFSGHPISGEVPLEVQFTDQSTGTVDSWSWNFGDGGTSSEQNPSHTYNSIGYFTVSLTVTGPMGGSNTKTKTDYIYVYVSDSYLLNPTYRFWFDWGEHFFTMSEAEKDYIINNIPCRYEGIAWYAYPDQQDNTLPVYRFWFDWGEHFFTMSEAEKDYVIATYPENVWHYEGIAFYAYPVR
jgi:parallel beta-helix repeat protein